MDLGDSVEKHLTGLGFQIEWVWMNRQAFFLLAWKGRRVQVLYADFNGRLGNLRPGEVKQVFLDLLGFLGDLEPWRRIIRGREIGFKWMMFKKPTALHNRLLKEAGVEPFFFPPTGDPPEFEG
jgi:hypothetical protein